jgi:hypothetical protein
VGLVEQLVSGFEWANGFGLFLPPLHMMLGISLGHDLRVGGQLSSVHTHTHHVARSHGVKVCR